MHQTPYLSAVGALMYLATTTCPDIAYTVCHDQFSSTILLEGPGLQETNEEVSPDTSSC